MARRILYFDRPRRFIVGTVGLPGERTFFLQAASGHELATVLVEKAQAALLADRLEELLGEVGETAPAAGQDDNDPLELPLEEEFRAGALALGWEPTRERIVVEAHALTEESEPAELGDDDPDAPDTLRVAIDAGQAYAFIRRARALVAAGRPPCPFCLQPLDATGHVCPRANGYRRRP
ncbi:MAG: DUF3090 family protein [Candidatus Nanopelagicales bacterium]